MAACFRSILSAAGISIDSDPVRCSILVTEPSRAALEEARRLRALHPHGTIVVYGPEGPEWRRMGAVFIGEGTGPSAIRDVLRRVVVKMPEESPR